MSTAMPTGSGPLAVRVREPSQGLFYWVVTQLSEDERTADRRLDASDHPYPTHEAAWTAGAACLRAIRTAPEEPR